MKPPSFPTDNLYKFLALSCLFASLFFIYLIYSSSSDIMKTINNLQIDAAINEAALAESPENSALLKDKIRIDHLSKDAYLSSTHFRADQIIYLFATLLFLTYSGLSFRNWYNRTQRYQDAMAKRQVNLMDAAEELELFKSLWQHLGEVRRLIRNYEEANTEALHEVIQPLNEFNNFIVKNDPFISVHVIESIKELLTKTKQLNKAGLSSDSKKEFAQELKEIDQNIENISSAMRSYLGD